LNTTRSNHGALNKLLPALLEATKLISATTNSTPTEADVSLLEETEKNYEAAMELSSQLKARNYELEKSEASLSAGQAASTREIGQLNDKYDSPSPHVLPT
jgi:hypothetical protein